MYLWLLVPLWLLLPWVSFVVTRYCGLVVVILSLGNLWALLEGASIVGILLGRRLWRTHSCVPHSHSCERFDRS